MGFEPSCGLFCGNPNLEPFPHALCETELGPGYMCICCRFFFLFSVAYLWYIQICFCYAVKWIFLAFSSFLDQFFHFWLEIFSCYSESLEDKIVTFVVWCHSFFYLQFVSPCLVSVFWALIDLSSPYPCFCFCFLLQFHGCWWETLGLVDCLALCMSVQTSLLTTSQWLLTLCLTKSSFVLG